MTKPFSDGLIPLFLDLVRINAVSLKERPMADELIRLLGRSGVRVEEDSSASVLGGDAGNLLCFPPGFDSGRPALMLTAHLDTVLPTGRQKAVVHPDRITSDGTGILGADNRLGLAVLVQLLRQCAAGQLAYRNFFCVFTVAEEIGLLGAGTVDLSPYRVSGGVVFDCSRRPGIYIQESVGLHLFTARIFGKAAHSGVNPEEGASAIVMASQAIARLSLGRLDANTTANVGRIQGGEAVNAIPEKVVAEGEVRSFDPPRILEQLEVIRQTFLDAVQGQGRLEFETQVDFEPYVLPGSAGVVKDLDRAIRAAGCVPQPIRYTGGSDANQYNAKGVPAVNIGIGAQKPHSAEEFVLLEDLDSTFRIAVELVRA